MKITKPLKFERPPEEQGTQTLSTIVETPARSPAKEWPSRQCPVNPSHSAAGTKIRPEPTPAPGKRSHGHTQKSGVGQPGDRKADSSDNALQCRQDQAGGHTPEMRSRVWVIRVSRCSASKRQNAANSTDNLVSVAEKIEHCEDHHEKIEMNAAIFLRMVPRRSARKPACF